MEVIVLILVIGYVVIAVKRRRSKASADPAQAAPAGPPLPTVPEPPPPPPPKRSKKTGKQAMPVGDPYAPPTFRVIALGAAGSGKTVFLASLFHRLNYQTPDRSYHLETEADQRIALGSIFSTISDTSKPWPAATRQAETREFVFDCVARGGDDGTRHRIMRVSCLEYAGELVERAQESPDGSAALRDLDNRIMVAHALLGVIDGRRVRQLLRGEPAGRHYFQHSLQPMLGIMQGASCPIHLVLTKWDLVRDFGEPENATDELRLSLVIEALMRYEHIKSLVYVHSRRQIVRLIPVSAVGPGFAMLDESGEVVKRPDGELAPTNVEVPFCAVLPDLFKQVQRSLDDSARRAIEARMRNHLRDDAAALVARLLRVPAGHALNLALAPYGGGLGMMSMFLDSMVAPLEDKGRKINADRDSAQRHFDEVQRLRGAVMDDFNKTLLRLEITLPSSELSGRW